MFGRFLRKLFDKPSRNNPDWASEIEAEEAAVCAEWTMPPARAGRASPRAGARLGRPATITIASNNDGKD